MDHKTESQTKTGLKAKILGPDEARRLRTEGWTAADLHVHTLHSYDVIPTRQVDPLHLYLKARRLGLAFIAFTDHDTMDAYDRIGWTRDGLVPAVEVKILDLKNVGHTVHINIYTLTRDQYREIRKISDQAKDIRQLTAYLKSERLPFIFNHPFWHEAGETLNPEAVIDIADLFPVLEYNMGRIGRLNRQALRLAEVKSKGIVAATDTHIGDIGRAFTLARGETFLEFFNRVQTRQSFIVPADLTLPRLKEETAVRIRHLFDKAGWVQAKDSLTIDTGSAILDGIIARLAHSRPKAPGLSRRFFQIVMEAASKSGIPGKLYLQSQEALANHIGRALENSEASG